MSANVRYFNSSFEILNHISNNGEEELSLIENAARTCYRSYDKKTSDGASAKKMIQMLIKNGHEAMLEHSFLSVRFTCSRAIANEIVRHRHCGFAQESTRYCNYTGDRLGNEFTIIIPSWAQDDDDYTTCYKLDKYIKTTEAACNGYSKLIELGAKPEQARGVLPLDLKTELVVSTNYREWRQIFKLRIAKDAHPDARYLMTQLLKEVKTLIPVVFDDINAD